MEIEFEDRYSATGTPYPNPWTMCRHRCEGMGVHPMPFSEWNEMSGERPKLCPQEDENGEWKGFPPPKDEWIFVYCAGCRGSGRRIAGRFGYVLDLVYTYYHPFHMAAFSYRHRDFGGDSRLRVIGRALYMFRAIWRGGKGQRALLRRRG